MDTKEYNEFIDELLYPKKKKKDKPSRDKDVSEFTWDDYVGMIKFLVVLSIVSRIILWLI